MNKRKIITHVLAASVLIIPSVVFAHGGVDDGHVVSDADTHNAGGSELLKAWSLLWWGLLAVSSMLTAALSFGVWKYLQVEPPKKTAPVKAEEKK